MKDIKPGVYPDLSNADYHGSNGISKSGLDAFCKDQSSLEWQKNCPVDKEKLKTLDFGTAFHAICLEPEKMKTEFVVMPKFGQKNVDKEEKKLWLAEHEDLTVVTTDDHKKLTLMFESVMAHPDARDLIEAEGIEEQSHYWEDPDTGILCKCRPDKIISNSRFLVDVKTTDELSKFHFSVDDYRYDIQAPFYTDGYNASTGEEKDTFIFLVIQKKIELGRYPVMCVKLPEWAVSAGRDEYRQNLNAYARFLEVGNIDPIQEIDMGYKYKKRKGALNY